MTSKQRLIEERLFKGLIQYIESLPGVERCILTLTPPPLPPSTSISEWEAHHQVLLPHDFKAFLATSDGVSLKWISSLYSSDDTIGCIEVNSLKDIVRNQEGSRFLDAFKIQDCEPFGSVFMTIAGSEAEREASSIYFLDKESGEWIYITNSFSNYFRLMVSCLGIKGWQLAYKQRKEKPLEGNGWPLWTMNWLYFYCNSTAKVIAAQINDSRRQQSLLDLDAAMPAINRYVKRHSSSMTVAETLTKNPKSTMATTNLKKGVTVLNMDRVVRTAQQWKEANGGKGGSKLTVELLMEQIRSSRQ